MVGQYSIYYKIFIKKSSNHYGSSKLVSMRKKSKDYLLISKNSANYFVTIEMDNFTVLDSEKFFRKKCTQYCEARSNFFETRSVYTTLRSFVYYHCTNYCVKFIFTIVII